MLTDEQITHFRERLEADLAHTQGRLDETTAELAADTFDEADDWSDSGLQAERANRLMRQKEMLEEELERIRRALARIDEGTYGLSEVSGEPIPIERLEALPTATTLVGEEKPPDW